MTTEEYPLWRRALLCWLREILTDEELDCIAQAVRSRHPALCRGASADFDGHTVNGACLLGYAPWRCEHLDTHIEIAERVSFTCNRISDLVGLPAAGGMLLNWYDTGRWASVMQVLEDETKAEIERRANLGPI